MMRTIAILTADEPGAQRLHVTLQAALHVIGGVRSYLVRDEPDVSFRSLSKADIVIFLRDVPAVRVKKALRALGKLSGRTRSLLVLPPDNSSEELFEYLHLGARAILRNDSKDDELIAAIPQVADGRLYLSPDLVPLVLEHYRKLCARKHHAGGGHRTLSDMRVHR